MKKRCDGCGAEAARFFGCSTGPAFCRSCVESMAGAAGLLGSDDEREVLRLAREWGVALRGGAPDRGPVDISPLVAACMRLEG